MKFLLLVSLLVGLVAAPAAARWTGTEADQMISFDDNEYARAVQILEHPYGGTIHVFWAEDAPSVREIHYGRSEDEGDTWTSTVSDRVISFPDGSDVHDECDVTMGAALIVVWSEDDTGSREVHYGRSTDNGNTWSSESGDLILSDLSSAVDTNTPSTASDAFGDFHVVWTQQSGTGTAEVHYSRSTDNGITWSGTSGDRVISYPDGNGAISPQITACEDRLFVVWREIGDTGDPSIHLGVSTDGGDTWSSRSADREITLPASIITNLAVSAVFWAGGMGVHVVYTASFDTSSPYHYEVYATTSFNLGETWSGEEQLVMVSHDEGAGRSASNPDVFVRDFIGPFAVWDEEEDTAGTKEQHVSHFDGDAWSGAAADSIISFPDGENGYRPSITGSHWITDGRDAPILWVAWTEFAGGTPDNYEVHLSIMREAVGGIEGDQPPPFRDLRCVPNPTRGQMRFVIDDAPHTGAVILEILDAEGRVLQVLTRRDATDLEWDGRDARGRRLDPGFYLARIRSTDRPRTARLVIF